MTAEYIVNELTEKFLDGITAIDEKADIVTVTVDHEIIHDVIGFLFRESGFGFLTDLTGIHYPDQVLPFGVVYHLHNFYENIRIRVKTFLPADEVFVPTVTDLFAGANWMERETFDFYGIIFKGHPNMKRILNVEDMDYFPLRKEYPLEDQTRQDKDDRFFGR
ncbi:MAG: NADH-quinone oxidoreductase subunit C [Syntrophothermus sp.]